MILSVTTLPFEECSILCIVLSNVVVLSVVMLNVVMLNVVMLNVVILNIVLLSVIMLSAMEWCCLLRAICCNNQT